jgi:hypothetical protein
VLAAIELVGNQLDALGKEHARLVDANESD